MVRILLAEDDEALRIFLKKALEKAGHAVRDYGDGAAAWRARRDEPAELLLTDIVMPEMDGIELARKATKKYPELRVMFITGFAAVALNPDNKAPESAHILSKPFHLRQLVDEIERLIAS